MLWADVYGAGAGISSRRTESTGRLWGGKWGESAHAREGAGHAASKGAGEARRGATGERRACARACACAKGRRGGKGRSLRKGARGLTPFTSAHPRHVLFQHPLRAAFTNGPSSYDEVRMWPVARKPLAPRPPHAPCPATRPPGAVVLVVCLRCAGGASAFFFFRKHTRGVEGLRVR